MNVVTQLTQFVGHILYTVFCLYDEINFIINKNTIDLLRADWLYAV